MYCENDGHYVVVNGKGQAIGQIYGGRFWAASSPVDECWYYPDCLRTIAKFITQNVDARDGGCSACAVLSVDDDILDQLRKILGVPDGVDIIEFARELMVNAE